MTDTVQQDLKDIYHIICNTVCVDCIYLFGSYANGTPNQDSDYDICVIVPDSDVRTADIMKQIRRALYDVQTKPIDLLVYHKSDFQQKSEKASFERQITREGVVLSFQ